MFYTSAAEISGWQPDEILAIRFSFYLVLSLRKIQFTNNISAGNSHLLGISGPAERAATLPRLLEYYCQAIKPVGALPELTLTVSSGRAPTGW
ncbi:hypothetical protein V6N13_011839 [Hibiscus sabdariffa]